MRIRTTRKKNNYRSDLLFKTPSYNLNKILFREKAHCSQVSNGNKNRLNHEFFYQSKIERLLHLNAEGCNNELQ